MRTLISILFLVWLIVVGLALWTPQQSAQHVQQEVRKVEVLKQAARRTPALSIFAGENWHLWLFFGVAVLATFYPPKLTPATVLAALLVASGLSLCTELVQEFGVPGRAFEWQDMGLNQIGILAGTATAALIRRLGGGVGTAAGR